MGGYNAGTIESTLTLDRTPFQAGLDAAKAEADAFEGRKFAANLDADIAELTAKIDEAKAKLDEIATSHPTAELDADAVAADEKLDATKAKVDELGAKSATVQVDADTAGADEKIAATSVAAEVLGGMDPEIVAMFQDADAITQMGAFKAYVQEQFPDGELRELKIMADVQQAMLNVDRLETKLAELKAQPYDPRIDANIDDLEAKVNRARIALFSLVDKHIVIDADDQGSFARLSTDTDALKAKLDKLAAERPTVVITADDAVFNEKVAAAAENVHRIPDMKETVLLAQVASAVSNVETLQARLDALTSKPEEVRVVGEIEDLRAKIDEAKLKLAELVDKHVVIDVDDEGSFARIKTDSERAAEAAQNVGTAAESGMGRLQMYAGLAAAALPFVSAAILAIPAALTAVIGPAAAVMAGMDGIKEAASTLAPQFTELKTASSAAFEQGLVPAIQNVSTLMPSLTSGLAGTATALSGVATQVTGVVSSAAGLSTLNSIFAQLQTLITGLGPGVALFAQNLMSLAQTGLAGLQSLSGVMTQIGQAWQSTIADLNSTGTATAAIEALVQVFGSLMAVIPPLVSIGAQLMATFGPGLAAAINAAAGALNILSGTVSGITGILGSLHTTTGAQNAEWDRMTGATQGAAAGADGLAGASNSLASAQLSAAEAAQSLAQAVADETAQFQSALGAEIAFEQGLLRAAEAAKKTADAVKAHGEASNEAKTAILAEEQAINSAAGAAQKKAAADTAALGPTASLKAGTDAYNSTLLSLASQASPQAQASLLKMTSGMTNAQLESVSAAAAVSGFATKLLTLPDGRTVRIIADPAQANTSIDQLNAKSKQPLGPAPITANNAPALSTFQQFLGAIATARPVATINGNAAPFNNAFVGARNAVQGSSTTALIAGSPAQMLSAYTGARGTVQGTPAIAPINGNAAPFTASANAARAGAQVPAVMPINGDPAPANGVLSALVGQVNGTTGTAHINAESAPATGILNAYVGAVNGTTGIAHVNAEDAPGRGILSAFLSQINGTTGTGHINANDSAARGTLSSLLSAINGSTATVTIRANKVGFAAGGIAPAGFANGGIAPARFYADGGIDDPIMGMTQMPVGVPAIAEPGNLRVFGDRSDVDEFYIPDDGAPASIGLLGEAASRQGYTLTPMADGGLAQAASAMLGQVASLGRISVGGGGGGGLTQEQAGQIIELLTAMRAELGRARQVVNQTTINNPVAERASDSLNSRLRTQAALGVFG